MTEPLLAVLSWIKKRFGRTKTTDPNLVYISHCLDFDISNEAVFLKALVHRSSAKEHNNERLELLGDAVLDLIAAHILYRDFPEINEGELTKLKSKLISREQLNEIGHQLGLAENIKLVKQKDLSASVVIGNVLEAIFGAIYLDQGFDTACRVGEQMFRKHCDFNCLLENMHDPKSLLLEWSQKRKKKLRFRVVQLGEEFSAEVFIGNQAIATGRGRRKRQAEKAAAKNALEVLAS